MEKRFCTASGRTSLMVQSASSSLAHTMLFSVYLQKTRPYCGRGRSRRDRSLRGRQAGSSAQWLIQMCVRDMWVLFSFARRKVGDKLVLHEGNERTSSASNSNRSVLHERE